jgi:predicted nucleic acid-binding protein
MVIVSDSSPIIALAACDKLGLLDRLFGQVCIPQAVFDELAVPNKPNLPMITAWAKGRTIAARNGVRTVGTIGILLWAKQRGFLAGLKPSLDTLMNTGFRVSDVLYRQILERAGE